MQLKAAQPNFAGCCQFSGALTDKAKANVAAFKAKAVESTVGQKVANSPITQKADTLKDKLVGAVSGAYHNVADKIAAKKTVAD